MFSRRQRNPLELLPEPKLPLKQWKSTYLSDQSTGKQDSLSFFWSDFYNSEEWSLWKVDYKYNEELNSQFMFDNLIDGFFNRLLETKRFISGVSIVYTSKDEKMGITGAFVIRGQDPKTAFSSAPEWDSFEYTHLKPENSSDVAFIGQIWGKKSTVDIGGQLVEVVHSQSLLGSPTALEDYYEILTESEDEA